MTGRTNHQLQKEFEDSEIQGQKSSVWITGNFANSMKTKKISEILKGSNPNLPI